MSKNSERFWQDCETYSNSVLVPKLSIVEWAVEGVVFIVVAIALTLAL